MAMFDDGQDNARDVMSDPDKRERIEQIALDRGISMQEAKEHFLRNEENQ